MGLVRTKEYDDEYRKYMATQDPNGPCNLCTKAEDIARFTYWRIVEAKFRWDLIAKIQHMIIPIRHTTNKELTKEELEELVHIRDNYLEQNYEVIAEATNRKKSIPGHHHLHLIILND